MSTIRTYSEMVQLPTFEERYEYLQLRGRVGAPTFGFERYLNQRFYTSTQWKQVRTKVIARDLGNDLAMDGFPIHDRIIIHHMNPMMPIDISGDDPAILDPEFLICTTLKTHNAIHYGDKSQLLLPPKPRTPGDTKLW